MTSAAGLSELAALPFAATIACGCRGFCLLWGPPAAKGRASGSLGSLENHESSKSAHGLSWPRTPANTVVTAGTIPDLLQRGGRQRLFKPSRFGS
ncbi:hypothetical protein [Levilactobacillus sp. HBUAS70063]|uniref:hypothetical protein n=1 Tax=Levilactobacillus sp. HBUAS70063 TaxID=3109359 RepID=UPI003132E3ED